MLLEPSRGSAKTIKLLLFLKSICPSCSSEAYPAAGDFFRKLIRISSEIISNGFWISPSEFIFLSLFESIFSALIFLILVDILIAALANDLMIDEISFSLELFYK